MNDYILNQWQLFRSVKFDELTDIRLQLHHAAQLAAAPGRYLLPTRRDDSNTNFIWSSQYQAMLGEPVGEEFPLQGALRPADLTIQLIDEDDIIMEALPLNGKSLEEAFGWIKKQLSGKKVDTTSLSLKMPYELPDHPVRSGEPFQFHSPQLFEELAKYWSNAHLLLCDIIHRTPDASPVRCWPHHFDISTLITVEEHPDPEKTKSIGVGLSPGDEFYPLPYFYVTPWPYPNIKSVSLPALAAAGKWHTRDWVGAILTAEKIVTQRSAEAQITQTDGFITSAVEAVKKLL
jgi:hypothetical protein